MNKISVGVYGDSYANMNLDKPGSYSWVHHLQTVHNVVNYGECGNSPYQCYKDYINNKDKHDYNIFIIPTLQRFFSEHLFNLLKDTLLFRNWFVNLSSVELAKIHLANQETNSGTKFKLKVVENVEFAMASWMDTAYLTETNAALIDKIRSDKNIILVDSNSSTEKAALVDVSMNELVAVGHVNVDNNLSTVDTENKRVARDIRCNHLSEENNLILGNILLQAIDNNFSGELMLTHDSFVIPSKTLEHYLIWEAYE